MMETDKPWREHFTGEEWEMLQTVPFWIVEMIIGRRFDSWMAPQRDEIRLGIKLSLLKNPDRRLSLTEQVFTSLESPFVGYLQPNEGVIVKVSDLRPNKQGLVKVRQLLQKVPLKEAEDFKEFALSVGTAYARYRWTMLQSNRSVIKGLVSAADALGVSKDTLRRLRAKLNR